MWLCERTVRNVLDCVDNSDRDTDKELSQVVDPDSLVTDSLHHLDVLLVLDGLGFV